MPLLSQWLREVCYRSGRCHYVHEAAPMNLWQVTFTEGEIRVDFKHFHLCEECLLGLTLRGVRATKNRIFKQSISHHFLIYAWCCCWSCCFWKSRIRVWCATSNVDNSHRGNIDIIGKKNIIKHMKSQSSEIMKQVVSNLLAQNKLCPTYQGPKKMCPTH